MTITIRLDPDTENELRQRLGEEGVSLSEFVREAIRAKLARAEAMSDPYALGAHLFGRYASGESDRSGRRKQIIRERLHEKHCGGQRTTDRTV